MNYLEQQDYLGSHRRTGLFTSLFLAICAIVVLFLDHDAGLLSKIIFITLGIGLLFLINYNPKYLYLNGIYPKRFFWAVRIRWVVCGLVLALGLINSGNISDVVVAVVATVWLSVANVLARSWLKSGKKDLVSFFPTWYAVTDFILLTALFFYGMHLILLVMLSSLAVHFAITQSTGKIALFITVMTVGLALLVLAGRVQHVHLHGLLFSLSFFCINCYATYRLSRMSYMQNESNLKKDIAELEQFTGYPKDEVERLLSSSGRILADNWVKANLSDTDREAMTKWYEDNSLYYIFDLTSFHLAYKQIVFMLDILNLAKGKCLDYGAGIGDLTLALAKSGHDVTYFDVEGKSQEYTRWRAEREKLRIDFTSSKTWLTDNMKRSSGFDTIISLDVLEHMPDVEGEMALMTSLLQPGGKLILTVPFGSSHNHPMHLNHDLDVAEYLAKKGFRDRKDILLRLTSSEALRHRSTLVFEKIT